MKKYAKKTIRKTKSIASKAKRKPARPRYTKSNVRSSKSFRKTTRKPKTNRALEKANRAKRVAKRLFKKYKVNKKGLVRKSYKKGANLFDNMVQGIRQFPDGSMIYDETTLEPLTQLLVDFFDETFPKAKRGENTAWGMGMLLRIQKYKDANYTEKEGEEFQKFPNVFVSNPQEIGEKFLKKREGGISQYKSIAVVLEFHVFKKTIDDKKRKYKQVADFTGQYAASKASRRRKQTKRSKVRGR